jgi:glycosyltransferase involved in cell wall biosynthesis
MAVTVPPELDWVLDLVAGQSWPQGDEDALRRCSQAWMDTTLAIFNLATSSNVTATDVRLSADSTSADQFGAFWSSYLQNHQSAANTMSTTTVPGAGGTFDDLFSQCQSLAGVLVDQANEVEYTKLVIVITVIMTAIMIALAIAEAIETLGASLVEIGLAVAIGREAVVMAVARFLQMALMMLVPDLVAQGVLFVQHKGWDGSKTWNALGNAVVGGLIGSFLGAGVGRLGWMGEGGNAFLQAATHFVEGGVVNDTTSLTTLGAEFAWADLHGDKATMAEIEQQLTFSNLAHQFLQGGLLATAFYLPHLAVPHGTAVTFTADDGTTLRAVISDKTSAAGWSPDDLSTGQLPAGVALPVFNEHGVGVGTVTFDDGQASVSYKFGRGSTGADLSGQGYTVVGHDGSLTSYTAGGNEGTSAAPQLVTQVRPSDGAVQIPVSGGDPVTVPAGSMVHYAADGSIYRADVVDGNTVTTWQTANPGDPLEVTGVTVHSTVPLLTGVFGVQASKVYGQEGASGEPVASIDWIFGKTHFTDSGKAEYYAAVSDRYSPASHPAASAGPVGPAYLALGGDQPHEPQLEPLSQDVVVNVAIKSGRPTGLLDLEDLQGRVLAAPSYLAGRLDEPVAYDPAEVALHLTVPAGTPAHFDPDTSGLLLDHGLALAVDRTWLDENDVWHIQAHVVDRAEMLEVPPAGSGFTPSAAELELAGRPPRITPDLFAEPDRGATTSFIVSYDDSRSVYKPEMGVYRTTGETRWEGNDLYSETWEGSGLWTRVPPEELNYRRELASYSTDQMLGFKLVPTTARASFETAEAFGTGSVQEFIPGGPDLDAARYPVLDQQRMAVLDYVTANSDRNANYLTGSDGWPIAIDNGETFPASADETIFSPFVSEWLGRPLSQEVLDQVRGVDLDAFREMLLGRGLGEQAVDGAVARLAEIQQAGMITGHAYGGEIYHFGGHAEPMRLAGITSVEARGDHLSAVVSDGQRSVTVRVDVEEAAGRLVISQEGQDGDLLREFAAYTRPVPGVFDVFSHADENGLLLDGLHVPFEELEKLLPHLSDGTTIRLCGCEAGADGGAAAARLAEVTGHDVLAADQTVWLDRNGNVFAASLLDGDPPMPNIGTDGMPDGNWLVFHSDGSMTPGPPQEPVTPVPQAGDPPVRLGDHGSPEPPLIPEHAGSFSLRNVFSPAKVPDQPQHEVVFEDGHFFLREVPRQAAPDPSAELSEQFRAGRLNLIREAFLAEHPPGDAAGEGPGDVSLSDLLPPWLDGQPGKILLVTTFWDITKGGIPVFNQELAKAFADAGHEVYVAVLDENLPSTIEVLPNGITLFTHSSHLPPDVDVVIGHTRFSGQQAQQLRANFYPDATLIHFQHMVPGELGEVKAGAIIFRAPRVEEYDVVVYERVNGTVIGHLETVSYADDTSVARGEDLIDGGPTTVGHAFFTELRKGVANEQAEQSLLKQADLGFGVGPAIARDMTRLANGDTRVHEVFPGLDFSRTVTPAPLDEHGQPVDGEFNVLLIGRADDPQKGALEAAQMIGALRADGVNVRLTIRGFEPGHPRELQAMADQLSKVAGAPVEVREFTTSADELTADLSEAHLVIAPGSGEGFGMSASGAAAAGVPVLVPDGSGYGLFLADPDNVPPSLSALMVVHQGFADQIPVADWTAKIRDVLDQLPAARANAAELVDLLKEQERTWPGTARSVLDAVRDLYRSRAEPPPGHGSSIGAILNPPPGGPHAGEISYAVVPDGDHLRLDVSDGTRTVHAQVDVDAASRRLVVASLAETGDVLRQLAGQTHADPGVFDVFAHADESGLVIDGLHVPFEALDEILPKLPGDMVIRLCGCTRRDGAAAVAELAERIGHDVIAADEPVWVDAHGNVFAARVTDRGGDAVPVIRDDGVPEGRWLRFHRDGSPPENLGDQPALAHVPAPGDLLIRLGAGDAFDGGTIFGPRAAADLHLSGAVQDFAGHSGYGDARQSAGVPYVPEDLRPVNIELQKFAENGIGTAESRSVRDMYGNAGYSDYTDVLDAGELSKEIARQAAEQYRQQQAAAGQPPHKDQLARQVRMAPGRFREFGNLVHEAAVMHDAEYLVTGGRDRGELDPVSVHDIPVDIYYTKRRTSDGFPRPGNITVVFPDRGKYPDELTLLEGLRGKYVADGLGTGQDFDQRYANAMLDLVRGSLSGPPLADLPAGFSDPHAGEIYRLALDVYGPKLAADFVHQLGRNPIDAFSGTDVGKFIKQCASLAVCNIGLEGARNPENFFTSLMTWHLVAGGRVSLHDALGYFNVMGPDRAGFVADYADWQRRVQVSQGQPQSPGQQRTADPPRTPGGWSNKAPGYYVNGVPDVRNSAPAAAEEFQRREREILGLYAESQGLFGPLRDAFFGAAASEAGQQQILRQLVDQLFTQGMGWPPSAVLFGELR